MKRMKMMVLAFVLIGCSGSGNESGLKSGQGAADTDPSCSCDVKDGKDGIDGLPGKDGEPGQQGAQGEQGIAGQQGPQGVAGVVGPQGAKGDAGEKGAAGAGYKSGSRLKARFYESDDGAQKFIGWRDSKYNFNCDIEYVAEDDVYRCVPILGSATALDVLYYDSSCTQQVTLAWKTKEKMSATLAVCTVNSDYCPIEEEVLDTLYRIQYGIGCVLVDRVADDIRYYEYGDVITDYPVIVETVDP